MKISDKTLTFGGVEEMDIANQSENSNVIVPPKLYAKLPSSQKTKANGQC